MPITQWNEKERPREKLISFGADRLSDAELIAILLRTGIEGKSAVDLGRELIAQAGSLCKLMDLSYSSFIGLPGLGPAKYVQFQAAAELSRRILFERMSRDIAIEGPEATKQFLQLQLRDKPHEVFCAIFLDSRHQIIAYRELFRGSINSAMVPPREVVKEALQANAASLVVAHNHPSGVADASIADRELTARLQQALALVDVRLIDHIIVGDDQCLSLAEQGMMI